ncbi:MAG TPA: hypothetical protein VHN20_13320 [Beijerinckiaceae bacterium]|nr:hypothetical protein [Beijerinckiaceae bacterium]
MKRRAHRTWLDLGAAAALLALAACSSDTNPVRDIALSTGVSTPPAKSADFVERSRPDSLDYQPVGVLPPNRAKAKTADEVKAVEAEMDQARAQNETKATSARQLGATPAPSPGNAPRTP